MITSSDVLSCFGIEYDESSFLNEGKFRKRFMLTIKGGRANQ